MLLKKMLRDMSANKAQFISIFLMALLGVFVYTGINAEWYGMQTEVDQYYADTCFPDYWAVGNSFGITDVQAAEAIPGVFAVQRRLTIDAAAKLDGSPTVRVGILDENKLATPYLIEGEPFDILSDGIWVDVSFAKAHGLHVSDSLTLEAMGLQVTKPILGLVMHPEYVYEVADDSVFTPDPNTFGFAFTPRSFIPMAGMLPYTELMVKLEDGADAKVIKAALEQRLSWVYSALLTRDTQLSPAQFKNEIAQNKALGGVFPVVFFLIAALTMLTTMTRLTAGQRTQIGTLKALGFKRRKILMHYVSYGLWLGLFGGLIGLLAGPAIIPPILYSMQSAIYNLPKWRAAVSLTDLLAVVLAVICCGASSYFACRRELSDAPAATLRPRVPKASRHTRLEKSRFWHRLGFSAQWNLRDILRSRVRSAMAVVGVVGCIALLLLGLGLNDSVNAVANHLYGELYTFDERINFEDEITEAQLDTLAINYPGQLIQESGIAIISDAAEKSGTLTIITPGDEYHFEDGRGIDIELPESGVAISSKMAQLLHVKVGDDISWRIYGNNAWRESVIGAIYNAPIGQGIAASQSAYEKAGETMHPTALLTSGSTTDAKIQPGIKNVQTRDALKRSFSAILDSIEIIIAILILAAIVLGVVVLYNLGSLSFTERMREMATLKVLGFPNKKIRLLLQKQNVWLTLLGIVIGIPVGFTFIAFMLSTISDSTDFVPYVSLLTLAACIGSTFLVSLLVNLLMSRKIRSIDMVSSLKSIE